MRPKPSSIQDGVPLVEFHVISPTMSSIFDFPPIHVPIGHEKPVSAVEVSCGHNFLNAELVCTRNGGGSNSVNVVVGMNGDAPVIKRHLLTNDLVYLRYFDNEKPGSALLHLALGSLIPQQ